MRQRRERDCANSQIPRRGRTGSASSLTPRDSKHACCGSGASGKWKTTVAAVGLPRSYFPRGRSGLPTLKLGFVYRAALGNLSPGAPWVVQYPRRQFRGPRWLERNRGLGGTWHRLKCQPGSDCRRSAQLSNYPTDLLSSPPQDLKPAFVFPNRSRLSATQWRPRTKIGRCKCLLRFPGR